MRILSGWLPAADTREAVWESELVHRRVAVARWRGTDQAPRDIDGKRRASRWSHQRRGVGMRPLRREIAE